MSDSPPISQVALSDDSDATFLIRWRGRQEGPYTAAVIESKLAANQIGLLHEISHNGQWVMPPPLPAYSTVPLKTRFAPAKPRFAASRNPPIVTSSNKRLKPLACIDFEDELFVCFFINYR